MPEMRKFQGLKFINIIYCKNIQIQILKRKGVICSSTIGFIHAYVPLQES